MKVDFQQETESGPIEFKGELSQDEVMFLIEYALVDLIKKGLVPVAVSRDPDSVASHIKGSLELQ